MDLLAKRAELEAVRNKAQAQIDLLDEIIEAGFEQPEGIAPPPPGFGIDRSPNPWWKNTVLDSLQPQPIEPFDPCNNCDAPHFCQTVGACQRSSGTKYKSCAECEAPDLCEKLPRCPRDCS